MGINELHIPGLELQEELGRGSHSVVYRARRNGRDYAVKVPLEPLRDDTEVRARLREAATLALIRHPSLPAVVDVGLINGVPYVAMELARGLPLAQELGVAMDEKRAVAMARSMASVLHEMHSQGLVHRDVKPANILIDDKASTTLVDFGLAAYTNAIEQPHAVGTFLYAAPEQTGILKRPVDGRADLYALGAVLYECMTGRPPFATDDVAELLRQHAAVVPRSVRELNPATSPGLGAIIERLLAKDPDDRYQSGAALSLDLARLDELASRYELAASVLLRTGELPAPPLPLELVGRNAELSALSGAWSTVLSGHGQTVLIEGPPGSGKSRLLTDFTDRLPFVLSCRCVADDPMPFAAVRQLTNSLLARLIDPQFTQERVHRESVRKAATDVGSLLRVIAPRLATAIGEFSATHELEEPEGRVEDAMATFLINLSTAAEPVALRVDDVQWIDHGSRKILELVARRLREKPLLLALAGRNDADSGPALSAAVSGLVHTAARVELSPLDEEATAALIRNFVGSRKVDPNVARLVVKLSDGLPLLARELTRALLDDGRLRPHWGHWQLDLDGTDLLDLPAGAQRLVERRLAWLGTSTRNVLRIAAVGGGRFDEELLAEVGEIDCNEIMTAVAEAQRAHLVERAADGRYKFVHTRIAEVLLSGIDPRARAELHRQYALALDQRAVDSDEHIFGLAHHYARAGADHYGVRAFETNLEAGMRALRSHAAADAYELLDTARQAALKVGLTSGPELWEALGEACHRTRRLQQAFDHYDLALAEARDPLVLARIQARRADVLLASYSLLEATTVVGLALKALNAEIPRGDALSAVNTAVNWGRVNLRSHNRPVAPRELERMRLLAKLYGVLVRIAYMQGDMPLMLQAGMRLGEPARVLGDTSEGSQALADHALMLSMLGVRHLGAKHAAHALAVATRLGDPIAISQARMSECYGHLFTGEVVEFSAKTRARLEEFRRWLPTTDVLNIHYALMYVLTVRGHVRLACTVSEEAMLFLDRIGPRAAITGRHPLFRLRCAILMMIGEEQQARELLNQCEDAAQQHIHDESDLRAHFGPMALLQLESQRHDVLEELEVKFRALAGTPPQWQLAERSGYACVALARLSEAMRAQRGGSKPDLTRLRQAIERADNGRRMQQHRSLTFVLQGALAWLEGKPDLALKRLDDGERLAREVDNPLSLFEAGRIRSHVYWSQGKIGAARNELVRAEALAAAHGLQSRLRRLRNELPLDEWRSTSGATTSSRIETNAARNPSGLLLRRHLEALLTVALATADEIDSTRQARNVLDHLVRILGAERGFLFLRRSAETLDLAAGRGAAGEDLDEHASYSRSVVERVRATRRPYVHSSGLDGLRNASDSVVAGDLRSIIAAPLLLDDQFIGVIYLDNHLASGVFSEEDLSILSALSAHIAIAVETNRAAEERRQFEARLRQQQKLESIGTLASGVAHEVNNPIQGIMSYAELIRRFSEKPETVHEFSGHIIDECKRVASIIKNLLALARTDEDKRTPENLFHIVQGSLSLFRVVLQKDQIQLDLQVPDDLPDICCNGQQIQQVIMNLLTNARDALNERYPGGGTDKCIRVTAALTDHDSCAMIRMTVEDHGTGIDPQLAERIFDPFFTTKSQGQGTGLGLWICHRIVSEQGGNLSVESELGKHTRFHVDLPVDMQ